MSASVPDNPKQKVRAHVSSRRFPFYTLSRSARFFYDFALSNTNEHRAHPCLAIMVHTSPPPPHLSPTLTFKKLFPPFPEVALWRWVVNWEYWRVLILSLPPLTCTDYSAFDLCVHLHFLESMQIVERPIWNGVDPIVGEIPTKTRKFHS